MLKKILLFFWSICKFSYEKNKYFDNVLEKLSVYFSYYYGASSIFSLENIRLMRRFYCFFPMYIDSMNKLNWEHYKILVNIFDKNERMFYYQLAIFCKCNDYELNELVKNSYYYII